MTASTRTALAFSFSDWRSASNLGAAMCWQNHHTGQAEKCWIQLQNMHQEHTHIYIYRHTHARICIYK